MLLHKGLCSPLEPSPAAAPTEAASGAGRPEQRTALQAFHRLPAQWHSRFPGLLLLRTPPDTAFLFQMLHANSPIVLKRGYMPAFSCPLISATDELPALRCQPQDSAFLFFPLSRSFHFCSSTSQGHLALCMASPHPPLLMVSSKCYQQLV